MQQQYQLPRFQTIGGVNFLQSLKRLNPAIEVEEKKENSHLRNRKTIEDVSDY